MLSKVYGKMEVVSCREVVSFRLYVIYVNVDALCTKHLFVPFYLPKKVPKKACPPTGGGPGSEIQHVPGGALISCRIKWCRALGKQLSVVSYRFSGKEVDFRLKKCDTTK
jgi:hypothetical protein